MKYNPEKHHRRSMRLKDYDYSQPGAYFVTICTQKKEFLFGNVLDGQMHLNDVGNLASNVWYGLPERYPTIEFDAFTVMPNHVHGVIIITSEGAGFALPDRAAASSAPTLGYLVRAFKSISAIQSNRLLSRAGTPVWQRNYYEHIIRDDNSLNRIREYILANPMRWDIDRENPNRTGEDEFDRWLDSFEDKPIRCDP